MSHDTPHDPHALEARRDAMLGRGLALVSAVASALAAAPYAHLHDTGEFVSVAADLGISHPPGHPLASLVLALARALPFGPLPLRVALVSGLAFALAVPAFHRLVGGLVRATLATGPSPSLTSARLVEAATTLAYATLPAVLLQTGRPEVYALEAAVLVVALERLVRAAFAGPSDAGARAATSAAFFLGLGLANHHLTAFLLLPAYAFACLPALATWPSRLRAGLAFAPGLSAYLLLPLRAHADAAFTLGVPDSLARLFWVVRGAAFAGNRGDAVPGTLSDRLADVGGAFVAQLGLMGLLLLAFGLFAGLRAPRTKRPTLALGLALIVPLVVRAHLGFVAGNPDALGYLLVALAAAVALAGLGAAAFAARFGGQPRAAVLAASLFGFVIVPSVRWLGDAELTRATQVEVIDDALVRELPYGAVVFLHMPPTVFRVASVLADEAVRPDVTVVAMPFLTYPGFVDALARTAPDVARALGDHVGLPGQAALDLLVAHRPVLVEMDPHAPEWLSARAEPCGAYLCVDAATPGLDDATVAERGLARARRTARTMGALGTAAHESGDRELRGLVALRALELGITYAEQGKATSARAFVGLARSLLPDDPWLEAAAHRLERAPEGVPLPLRQALR